MEELTYVGGGEVQVGKGRWRGWVYKCTVAGKMVHLFFSKDEDKNAESLFLRSSNKGRNWTIVRPKGTERKIPDGNSKYVFEE